MNSPTTRGKSPVTKACLEGHGGKQGVEHGQIQQSSREEWRHQAKRELRTVLQVSKCQEAVRGLGEDRDFPLYLSSYLSPGASGRREGEDMAPSHHSSNFLEHDLKGCQVH